MKLGKEVRGAMLMQLREQMDLRLQRGPEDAWEPNDSMYCEFLPHWKRELAVQMLMQLSMPDVRIAITTRSEYRAIHEAYTGMFGGEVTTYVIFLFQFWGATMPTFVDSYKFASTLLGFTPDSTGASLAKEIVNELSEEELDTLNRMTLSDVVSYYASFIPPEMETWDDFLAFINDDSAFDSYHQEQMAQGGLYAPFLWVQPGDAR